MARTVRMVWNRCGPWPGAKAQRLAPAGRAGGQGRLRGGVDRVGTRAGQLRAGREPVPGSQGQRRPAPGAPARWGAAPRAARPRIGRTDPGGADDRHPRAGPPPGRVRQVRPHWPARFQPAHLGGGVRPGRPRSRLCPGQPAGPPLRPDRDRAGSAEPRRPLRGGRARRPFHRPRRPVGEPGPPRPGQPPRGDRHCPQVYPPRPGGGQTHRGAGGARRPAERRPRSRGGPGAVRGDVVELAAAWPKLLAGVPGR